MSVISKTNKDQECSIKSYPWIGEFTDGTIVLFIEKNTGVVIRKTQKSHTIVPPAVIFPWMSNESCEVGHYSDDWKESIAKHYDGEVTLSNEKDEKHDSND